MAIDDYCDKHNRYKERDFEGEYYCEKCFDQLIEYLQDIIFEVNPKDASLVNYTKIAKNILKMLKENHESA